MRQILLAALAACLVTAVVGITGPDQAQAANPESRVTSYISSQLHRLDLKGDQRKKFARALATTSAKRRKIFADVGICLKKKPSWIQLLKLQSRIGKITPSSRARAAKVLTKKQLATYDKIRLEVKKLLTGLLT